MKSLIILLGFAVAVLCNEQCKEEHKKMMKTMHDCLKTELKSSTEDHQLKECFKPCHNESMGGHGGPMMSMGVNHSMGSYPKRPTRQTETYKEDSGNSNEQPGDDAPPPMGGGMEMGMEMHHNDSYWSGLTDTQKHCLKEGMHECFKSHMGNHTGGPWMMEHGMHNMSMGDHMGGPHMAGSPGMMPHDGPMGHHMEKKMCEEGKQCAMKMLADSKAKDALCSAHKAARKKCHAQAGEPTQACKDDMKKKHMEMCECKKTSAKTCNAVNPKHAHMTCQQEIDHMEAKMKADMNGEKCEYIDKLVSGHMGGHMGGPMMGHGGPPPPMH